MLLLVTAYAVVWVVVPRSAAIRRRADARSVKFRLRRLRNQSEALRCGLSVGNQVRFRDLSEECYEIEARTDFDSCVALGLSELLCSFLKFLKIEESLEIRVHGNTSEEMDGQISEALRELRLVQDWSQDSTSREQLILSKKESIRSLYVERASIKQVENDLAQIRDLLVFVRGEILEMLAASRSGQQPRELAVKVNLLLSKLNTAHELPTSASDVEHLVSGS